MCDHIPSVPVRFDVPIPEVEMENVPLLFGKKGARVKALITSPVMTSCMTHFVKGRTRPCYAPVLHCPGCAKQHPRIWKGFLGAMEWYTKGKAIVMLGVGGARPYRRRLMGEGRPVRGCLLTLEHQGGHPDGAVSVHIDEHPVAGRVPDAFDVEGHLKSMWARWAALQPPDDDERYELIPVPGC